MVFYGVVGAAREVLGNCSPLVAQLPVLFADELLLHAQIEYATSKLVTYYESSDLRSGQPGTCILAAKIGQAQVNELLPSLLRFQFEYSNAFYIYSDLDHACGQDQDCSWASPLCAVGQHDKNIARHSGQKPLVRQKVKMLTVKAARLTSSAVNGSRLRRGFN